MKSLLLIRPIAYFLDFMIMWCACVLPQILSYYLFDGLPFKYFNQPYHVYFWVLLTVSFPIWLYFILHEMSDRQSTIGKRIMHLKVVGYDNLKISKKKSFVRTFVKLLPWEIAHLGLLPIYFSEVPQPTVALYLANGIIVIYLFYFIMKNGKYAIHDMLSKTRVVISD